MKSTLIANAARWLFRHRGALALSVVGSFVLVVLAAFAADRSCRFAADGRVFCSVEKIPAREVGLVLGTGRLTKSGRPNLHFKQRIEAAAALYHSGKVRHLLVSGDNHASTYDEPADMRDALVEAGVPADAITRDCAGFRTLDSVVRAKDVFALTQCVIITENFHCPRALWIARRHGLDAVAFAAPDLGFRWSAKVKARECLARTWCGIDLYVLNRGPKFTGPREPILLSGR